VSPEAWGAALGLLVYGGMKAIDRAFKIVDHVLEERGLTDHDPKETPDEP